MADGIVIPDPRDGAGKAGRAPEPLPDPDDDDYPPLYRSRQKIFPKAVSGFFRRLKWQIMGVTLAVYYLTPWIRWDRGDGAPDQAVLIDLANRRFYFFWIEIWPQEFYYVAGLLIMAGIGLFLVTSAVGRAWCGYFCPQTVWTDLFMFVERRIEGDRNAQIRLDKAPWTPRKVWLRTLKHATWLGIAFATGGAWIFYFADAPSLFVDFWTGQAAGVAYATVAILTFTTYTLGGLMREQVCTYMCPWPRIQGAMLDENSLIVTYNDWRGEPRSKHRKKAAASGEKVGDCIDCMACVNVCPVGIDIRKGQQLECITCALCIDACDAMMEKVDLPKGLISYSTLHDYELGVAGRGDERPTVWKRIFRPRTLIYAGAWAAIGLFMLLSLTVRDRIDVNVIHDRNPVFVTLSDGSIRNGYTVKILNMVNEPRTFQIRVEDLPGAHLAFAGGEAVSGISSGEDLDGPFLRVEVDPDRLRSVRIVVTMPREALEAERTEFTWVAFEEHWEYGFRPETSRAEGAFFAPEGTGE